MKITIELKTNDDGSKEFSITSEERQECFIMVAATATSGTFDQYGWACEMMALYAKSLLMKKHPDSVKS